MEFPETAEIGEKGEDKVYDFLRKHGWIVVENNGALRQLSDYKIEIPENYLNELSKEARMWLDYTITTIKSLLREMLSDKFDFIARRGKTIIMGDIKTKRQAWELGRLDESHYKHYEKFMKVVPFLIFYYIREEWAEYYKTGKPHVKEELYVTMLRDRNIEPKYKSHGDERIRANYYEIPRNEMMEANKWAKTGCSLKALRALLPK